MTNSYQIYRQARDAAWRALLSLPSPTLPVDIEALARKVGVDLLPFPAPQEQPRLYRALKSAHAPCVALRVGGQWHIFLETEALDDSARRFAVAHELGHVLLRHPTKTIYPGAKSFPRPGNPGDQAETPDNDWDMAADIFASRLLSPACVLHALGITTAEEIAERCGMPPRAAALRAERMALLNERNVFFSHELERKVYAAFLPWIKGQRISTPMLVSNPSQRSVSLMLPLPERKPQPRGAVQRYHRSRILFFCLGGLAVAGLLTLFFLLGRDP